MIPEVVRIIFIDVSVDLCAVVVQRVAEENFNAEATHFERYLEYIAAVRSLNGSRSARRELLVKPMHLYPAA